MIYEEFGEKAFTAKGFNAKGNIYTRFLSLTQSMTDAYCPPCYDADHYGWAASIPVNEISNVKFYEAGSNLSKWLPRHLHREPSRPQEDVFTAGGYRSPPGCFIYNVFTFLQGKSSREQLCSVSAEFTRLESL